MSRDALAEQVGLSRNGIVNLEVGRAANLRVSIVLTIAAALGVPPVSLLFPDITESIEVLPGKKLPGLSALGWFIGAGGGPIDLTRDRSYAPDGVDTDESMRIPLQLLRIDQNIAQIRHGLQIKNGQMHAANDEVRQMMQAVADDEQGIISSLELERERLLDEYRKSLPNA